MKPSSLPPVACRPARRLWVWALLLVPLLLLVTVTATITSLFHLVSDVRALSNGVMKSSCVEWRQNIAVNANWLTVGAVRAGLSRIKLDPGARTALQSIRSAAVGGLSRGIGILATGSCSHARCRRLGHDRPGLATRGRSAGPPEPGRDLFADQKHFCPSREMLRDGV